MKINNIIKHLLLLTAVFSSLSCSSDNTEREDPGGLVVGIDNPNIKFDCKTNVRNINITAKGAWDAVSDKNWCTAVADISKGILKLGVTPNGDLSDRNATVTVTGSGETKYLYVTQEVIKEYEPGDAGDFSEDTQLKFTGVALEPYLVQGSGYSPEKTIDGIIAAGNLWHSGWAGIDPDVLPFELEYTLEENTPAVDYLIIYPRTAGDGVPENVDIYVSTKENPGFVQAGSLHRTQNSGEPIVYNFPQTVTNPVKIKIVIHSALQDNPDEYKVCIAEFQAFARTDDNIDPGIFSDPSCSGLKPGVTLDKIKAMTNPFLKNVAYFLYTDNYEGKEFRIQEYEAFRPVSDLKNELKVSGYNQFENPAGIFFNEGETAMVFMSGAGSTPVYLRVTNFGNEGAQYGTMQSDNKYMLKEGANKIKMKGKGNAYISYYTPDYEAAPNIKVHIASGKTIGCFDIARHDNNDWMRILAMDGEVIDMKGKYIMLSYQREGVRRNTPSRGVELLGLYDEIVLMQYGLMGLEQYGRMPKNRMFGRSKYDNGNPWADGFGMAYPHNSINMYASIEGVTTNGWGVYHELGHVNQVRPGFKWQGTTEITNNLYSTWNQYNLDPSNTRLEYGEYDAKDGLGKIISGHFNGNLMNTVYKDGGIWLDQGNVFCSLAALWQLQLYYGVIQDKTAYQDFFETLRTLPDVAGDGQNHVNFVKYFCDAVKEDLTDFFEKSKILVPFSVNLDDYGQKTITVTTAMVQEAKGYVTSKGYPKPESDVLFYITARTLDIFRDKQPLADAQTGTGISISGGRAVISNSTWKNAVGFEAYKGETVVAASVSYTGSADQNSTALAFPADANMIKAVGWDGTRKTVYQK